MRTQETNARPDIFVIALTVTVAVIAALVAWRLIGWAHATRTAVCVVDNAQIECSESVPAAGRALIAAAGAVGMGAATAAIPRLVRRRTAAAPVKSSEDSATSTLPASLGRELPTPTVGHLATPADRTESMVVLECIELLDRRDPDLDVLTRQHLERVVREAGCAPFDPTGQPFDHRAHRAVDRVPTNDPAVAGTIAVTERLGWFRHDRVVRPADVVVNVVPERMR